MKQEQPKNSFVINKLLAAFLGFELLAFVFGMLMSAGKHYSDEMFLGISFFSDWLPGFAIVAFLFGWLASPLSLEKPNTVMVKNNLQLRDFLNFEFLKFAMLSFGPILVFVFCTFVLWNDNEMLKDAARICMQSYIASFMLRYSLFDYREVPPDAG
jgi:hypothetical protein